MISAGRDPAALHQVQHTAATLLEVRPETPFLTRPDEQFVGSGSDRHR